MTVLWMICRVIAGVAERGGGDGGDGASNDSASVVRGRNYANWMAKCTASAKLLCDNLDTRNPGFQVGAGELIARLVRDASAHVQTRGRADPHDTLQPRNPPIPQIKNRRKETRVEGACEGGPAKRVRRDANP